MNMRATANLDERALQAATAAVPLTRWTAPELGGWTNEEIARAVIGAYLRTAKGCLVCGGHR